MHHLHASYTDRITFVCWYCPKYWINAITKRIFVYFFNRHTRLTWSVQYLWHSDDSGHQQPFYWLSFPDFFRHCNNANHWRVQNKHWMRFSSTTTHVPTFKLMIHIFLYLKPGIVYNQECLAHCSRKPAVKSVTALAELKTSFSYLKTYFENCQTFRSWHRSIPG